MGWLLPLGSHKVMGSFAGYSVSISTFEIVWLFFNSVFSTAFFQWLFLRLFWKAFSCDVAIWWIAFFGPFFSTPEDLVQFALHIPFNFSCASRLPGCNFLVATLSTLLDTRRLFSLWPTRSCFVFPVHEEDLWCLKKKTRDAWRGLAKLSTLEDIVLDVDTKSPA